MTWKCITPPHCIHFVHTSNRQNAAILLYTSLSLRNQRIHSEMLDVPSIPDISVQYCTGVYGSNGRGCVTLLNFEKLATKAKLRFTDVNLGNLS
jgi:hypothetical protein